MHIAIDDTDSRSGGCTTYLLTEMIRELSDMDIIGNPRLVRLNPAVPWKTRGNASLVLTVGKGTGVRKRIGVIGGEDIHCFSSAAGWEPDEAEIIERIRPVIEDNRSEGSDPGLAVSVKRPPPSLYWDGVRKTVDKEYVINELKKIGAVALEMGCGRGIIGAACGMAWEPCDSTYEVIAYREMERRGTERECDASSVKEMDSMFPGTFNSWNEREGKPAMIPSSPCPVLFGLRGDDETEAIKAAMYLRTERIDRWMTFLTNQGTDDHIIRDMKEITENCSYEMEGIVRSYPRRIRGGHALTDIETRYGVITCAAYEPSKEFRMLFDHLVPGDRIVVIGELREHPRTLNAEKVRVVSLSDSYSKMNPVCPGCGKRMESAGKGQGYRCRGCRTRSASPITEKETRWAVPGWYEPPVSARRHLSKPLKRMSIEQPVEFVNSRRE